MGLERFSPDSTIFRDESVLRDGYQPNQLIERDEELEQYQSALKPVINGAPPKNLFLYGQTGVGKTLSSRMVVAGCLVLGIASMIVFLVGPGLPTIVLATVLFGTATSFFAALEPKVLDGLTEDERNAGFGVFRTAYIVGGSTGSIGVGAFADTLGWAQTLWILAVLFAASLVLVLTNRLLRLGY